MSAAPVLTERVGAVLKVTLNRPEVSNALDPAMLAGLAEAWRKAAEESVKAVVITGAGRNFCAGADLAFARHSPEQMDLRRAFHPPMLALMALDKPVIAAVNGAAAGGGLSLALAADLRILATDAKLVPGWVRIGLVPDLGASWFAARMLGVSQAFEWFASGMPLLAEAAQSKGLANALAEPEQLVELAMTRAAALADQPGRAVALTKRLLRGALHAGFADHIEAEAAALAEALAAPALAAHLAEGMARHARD